MGDRIEKRIKCFFFIIVFIVTFGVLLIYYYAYFPGLYSPDSNDQLRQVVSGIYSDWHPVIHTGLFFTLPLQIFHSNEVIVFLQILWFSLAFSYLLTIMRIYGSTIKFVVVCMAVILLSPMTGNILMYPWKDCRLAVFGIICTAHFIKYLDYKRRMAGKGIKCNSMCAIVGDYHFD